MIAAREVLYKIRMDSGELESSLKKTEQGFDAAEAKAKKVEASLNSMGKAAGIVSVAMAGVAAISIKSAMDFNSALSKVEALIPGQKTRINELKKEIQILSPEVRKTTSDLTEGLYQVISAFGDSADAAKQLGVAAKLATAGNATTLDSINLLSAVTKGYGNTSLEAQTKVADLATLTVKLGQTTMPELANSIQRVTSSSNALGVSQAELFAVFSASTGVIGGAAEVSTGLTQVQSELMKGTSLLNGAFEKLGVSTGAELVKKFGGLGGALNALKQSAGGTNEGLIKLFGSVEASKVALYLTGAGASKFSSDLKAMGTATGETDKAFTATTTGVNAFGASMESLGFAATTASQKIGDELIRSLNPLAPAISLATKWLSNMDDQTIKNITSVGKLIGVAAAATAAVITFRKAFMALSLVMSKNPVGLVIAGLVTAGVAIAEVVDRLKESAKDYVALTKETKALTEEYDRLSKKTEKTIEDQKRCAEIVEKLKVLYPSLTDKVVNGAIKTGNLLRVIKEENLALVKKEMEGTEKTLSYLSEKDKKYKGLCKRLEELGETHKELLLELEKIPKESPPDDGKKKNTGGKEILKTDEQAQALKTIDEAYKARLELARKMGQETEAIEREYLAKRLATLTEFYVKEYEISKNSGKALSKKIQGYKVLGKEIEDTVSGINALKVDPKIEIPKEIESAVKDIQALGQSVEALGKAKGAKEFSDNLAMGLGRARSLATTITGELAGLATGISNLIAGNKARDLADRLFDIEQEKNTRLLDLDYQFADMRKTHQEEEALRQEQFREQEYQKKLAYYDKSITDLENSLTAETNIEAYRKTEKKLEEERFKKEELEASKRKEAEDSQRKKKHDAEEKARLNQRQKLEYEFQKQKIDTENQAGQAAAEAAQIKAVIDKANSVFALSLKIAEYTAWAAGSYASLNFVQGAAFTAAAAVTGAQIGVVSATPGPPAFRALPMPAEPRPLAQGGIYQPKTGGHIVQPLRVAEAGVPELWLPITQENLDKLLKSVSSTSSSSVTSSFVYQPNFVVNLSGKSDKEEFMSFIKNEASRELLEVVKMAEKRYQV